MEKSDALSALAALAQETRLEIFRYLVEVGPEGAPAGHIGRRFELPSATSSFHLKELTRAGLVTRRRQSRSIIYALDVGTVRGLLTYLTEDCCGGRPELCAIIPPSATRGA